MDVGAIATAVSLASKAYSLAQKANALELQNTIMTMRESLMDARDELLGLRARVHELEAQLAARAAMEWDGTVYWRLEGDERVGPFCPKCFDGVGRAARLTSLDLSWRGIRWCCNVCDADFATKPASGAPGK